MQTILAPACQLGKQASRRTYKYQLRTTHLKLESDRTQQCIVKQVSLSSILFLLNDSSLYICYTSQDETDDGFDTANLYHRNNWPMFDKVVGDEKWLAWK